jgi:hypothetical protein
LKFGRAATGVEPTKRHRLQKLAAIKPSELKTIATEIQKGGGDATVSAVLRVIKSTEIKELRRARSRAGEMGAATSGAARERYVNGVNTIIGAPRHDEADGIAGAAGAD